MSVLDDEHKEDAASNSKADRIARRTVVKLVPLFFDYPGAPTSNNGEVQLEYLPNGWRSDDLAMIQITETSKIATLCMVRHGKFGVRVSASERECAPHVAFGSIKNPMTPHQSIVLKTNTLTPLIQI